VEATERGVELTAVGVERSGEFGAAAAAAQPGEVA
jgi:hypothetical protein